MQKIVKKVGEYYLDIYYPIGEFDETELPILYVLDGDAFASTISEAVKLQIRNSGKTGVNPMIIVGISYHNSDPFNKEKRFIDFTPTKIHEDNPADFRFGMPKGGGINKFITTFIQIHQIIINDFSIDKGHVGILGHSLGGLCVLEFMLRDKLSFLTDFLAISPSLWWDNNEYFNKLDVFDKSKLSQKRVIISVGSNEGDMVELSNKAFKLVSSCNSIKDCTYYIIEDENHMSVVFTVISRYLRWFSMSSEPLGGINIER
ncbi:alpha/beta hydrolase [Lactococcus petauri]|uniref:alpha/beta hydrolase n=1 Tax=Lactococcus petauri TaxID=1940789 RepID=UPI00254F14FE|nr:alpha/beta hydrolase-fold protein [Lactococcus petauri]